MSVSYCAFSQDYMPTRKSTPSFTSYIVFL